MAQRTVLDEYENCIAVRASTECFVKTKNGEKFEFGSSTQNFNDQRARLYAALYVQLGPVSLLDDDDVVPLKVATAGKPAIAAYLFANHAGDYYTAGQPFRDVYVFIADSLDVGVETVKKYMRRVLREARGERVGGAAR